MTMTQELLETRTNVYVVPWRDREKILRDERVGDERMGDERGDRNGREELAER